MVKVMVAVGVPYVDGTFSLIRSLGEASPGKITVFRRDNHYVFRCLFYDGRPEVWYDEALNQTEPQTTDSVCRYADEDDYHSRICKVIDRIEKTRI